MSQLFMILNSVKKYRERNREKKRKKNIMKKLFLIDKDKKRIEYWLQKFNKLRKVILERKNTKK